MQPDRSPCDNCGQPVGTDFCPRCGQRRRERLTLRSLAGSALRNLTDLDRGFGATVVGLTTKPGATIRHYVAGGTVRFVGPLRYAIVTAALVQLLLWWFGGVDDLVAGFVAALDDDARQTISGSAGVRILSDWFLVLMLGAIPFVAIIGRLVFRRAGFNLAEHGVFAAYVYAQQALLVGVLAVLGTALQSKAGIGVTAVLVIAGYYVYAAIGFFRIGLAGDLLRGLAAVAMALTTYTVLLVFAIGIIIGIAQ